MKPFYAMLLLVAAIAISGCTKGNEQQPDDTLPPPPSFEESTYEMDQEGLDDMDMDMDMDSEDEETDAEVVE